MVSIINYAISTISKVGSHINHLPSQEIIIVDIAIILIISAVFAFIAKMLKQPLIPAYVLTGLVIGPLVFGLIGNPDIIYAFSEIGIAFLLFTAGLEISFQKIKEANLKKIVFVGLMQVGIIFIISFMSAHFLNLTALQASYIGIIIAFGSTMVDIKLLSDRDELVTLHGRLILGILLLQDLIAIVAIVVFTTGGFALTPLIVAFAKLALILVAAVILQRYVLNRLFKFAAQSNELLFLASLAVLFFFIILSYISEISIVIGAFIAGVSLANSPFKTELESRISPLRDFFAILFFVALGMQVVFVGIGERLILLVALIVGALVIKPFVTLILLRVSGYQPKTSFLTAISLAQLSEFSLIVGTIGVMAGVLSTSIFSTVILATIITMSLTPYFIGYKQILYRFFEYPIKLLGFLPMGKVLEYKNMNHKEIILIGSHRMGGALMEELLGNKDELLVVDHNPDVINVLMKKKVPCLYGDITSPDMLDKIDMKNAKLIISTIPNYEDTLHLLKKVKKTNHRIKVIVTGARISEALKLYKNGADFVITPKIIAGQELRNIIHERKPGDLRRARIKHLKHIKGIHRLLY